MAAWISTGGGGGGSGGAPSGAAGGDLGGSYPNPTVGGAHFGGAPGQFLKNAAGVWLPASIVYADVGGTPASLPPSGAAGGDLGGSYPTPTVTAGNHITTELTGTDLAPATTVTGTGAAARYFAANATGAPAAGTWQVGDIVPDSTGRLWICTAAGTPGTWTQVGGGGAGAWTLIQDQVLGANAATVTFAAIPGTYKHLKIYVYETMATNAGIPQLRMNGDTGANYSAETLASGTATPVTAQTAMNLYSAAQTIGHTMMMELTIPGYASAFSKLVLFDGVNQSTPANGTTAPANRTGAGLWGSTAAIASLLFMVSSTGVFTTGSRFTLYGLS